MVLVYVIAAWLLGGMGVWAMLYAYGEDEGSNGPTRRTNQD